MSGTLKTGWWSSADDNILRDMREKGFSCRQISLKIGKSRNAIIGRLGRMPNKPVPPPKLNRQKSPNSQTPSNSVRNYFWMPQNKRGRVDAAILPKPTYASNIASKGISLLDATEESCLWPLEGKTKQGYPRICGLMAKRGLRYCEGHIKIVYRTP